MKKKLLSVFGLAISLSISAQTINASDLNWYHGKTWPGVTYQGGSNINLTSGTGISNDLTNFTFGVLDTIFALPGDQPGDSVKIKSKLLGETNYTFEGTQSVSDFKVRSTTLNGNTYSHAPWGPNKFYLGFSHAYGNQMSNSGMMQDQNNAIYTSMFESVVISSGTVKLSWGTFDCLVVEEALNLGSSLKKIYYFETKEHGRVAAFDPHQQQTWVMSNPLVTNAANIEASVSFEVYPNPSANFINFSSNKSGQVSIFDLNGKSLISQLPTNGKTTIDLGGIPNGIYQIMFESDNQISTTTFIKQ